MNCVNKKSKEFKKLVADYNVSENTMELLIHQYWIEKGSEEDFPTKAYLNTRLGLTPYEEHIDNVIKVWDNFYSHPLTFNDRAKAYKAKEKALKVFPTHAVNMYSNDKGVYTLNVRKPVKNLKAELNRIEDNGSFSSLSLDLGIDDNKKYYPMKMLESMFYKFNSDRTSKALADKVFSLAKSLNIPVNFASMKSENLGKYIPGKGIYLNKDFFSRLDNNEKKDSIILHEVIHAVCNYALSDIATNEKPQALVDFKNEITQIYDKVKSNKALEGEIGITSVKEFVAELSNPIFREKLQKIEGNNSDSLWHRIVDTLKKLLNIHNSSDYYTRAMNTLNNALDAFDRNTYMEYNGILDELRESQREYHEFSDKAKNFLSSLSEKEMNSIADIINRESSDYSLSMNSSSTPKKEKHYFTFDDGTQIEVPFTPNEQQAKALNVMDKFINSNETSMTLTGYAGTGKTSIMQMLQKKAMKKGRNIVFTATTNKAAAVLRRTVGDKAMTLNKAFGINVEADFNKKYDADNLITVIKDSNKIGSGDIVVIDESSMINEESYDTLNNIAEDLGAKIIYVGDKAQLPPVKENKVSKAFRDNKDRTVVELTKVERTGDNAILKEATDIRNGQGFSGVSSFNKEGKGVAYVKPQHKDDIDEIVKHFTPELKKDPDSFRIIAYTNAKVTAYNASVRKTLGYDDTPRVGEPIMGYFNYGYKKGKYEFINSESYKVTNVSPARSNRLIVNGKEYVTTVNDITVEDVDGSTATFAFTDIKHNQHNREVAKVLGEIVSNLWDEHKRTYNTYRKKEIRNLINVINKSLFVNDSIRVGTGDYKRTIVKKVWDFGYAITAHKSQGSTFKNILIDDVDIQTAKESNEDGEYVNLSIPTDDFSVDDFDAVDPEDMTPAEGTDMDGVQDMNGAKELSSTPVSLDWEASTDLKSTPKVDDDSVNIVQQLEYVAISRATDTATVISNNVKEEGSPLHPEKSQSSESSKPVVSLQSIMTNDHTKDSSISQQLINHLKSQGINVKDRAAMEDFLKTHKLEYLQQLIKPYGKEKPYKNFRHKGKISEILSIVKAKKYNKAGTDAVTLGSEGHRRIYLIDHSADSELTENLKDGDGFGIRNVYKLTSLTYNDIREITRNIASDYQNSKTAIRDWLQKLGVRPENLPGVDIDAAIKGGIGDYDKMDAKTRGFEKQALKDRSSLSSGENQGILPFYMTSTGEVYGFVDKDGNIYLDETKISPEHPIHEYTHLWDRTVKQKNPKLWQRGVELMKQTSLWNEILNDEHYGKVWQSMNLPQDKLDSLIASEVHARFTGEGGEALLNKLAKEKGQSGIIAKLKQWILDVWKDLKATFGNWSQEDIDKLTLKDFNHMTVRDFADGINLNNAANATYNEQQQQSVEPDLPEVSALDGSIKPSKPERVLLPGYEHFDRMVKNGEQKGIEVDAEWKIPLLKELDSKIYNPTDEWDALGLQYDDDKQTERDNNEFYINEINVLLRRVHSKEDWNNLDLRNKLIKEEYEQNQYDKLARQIDNLNEPDNSDFDFPLTSSQVKHGVEMAMDYASDIITRLQAEGEEYAKEINPNFQPKEGFDFKTASRKDVIEAVGLTNIFEAVHTWFNYNNDFCNSDEALDESGDKMSYLHENWDAVMWMGAPYFNFNEGFGFKEQIGGRVEKMHEDNQLPHDETYNKDDEEDVLVELFGEGREHYLVDSKTIDVLGSMSTLVKRVIHECYLLDEEGKPIINNIWGLKERVSIKDATISLLSWTQGAITYEDMLEKIIQKAKLKKNNWVNQLLVKLNDNSGQYTDFQSQFFTVFCKHRTNYTVGIDEKGKIKSIPANKNPVLKQIMDTAKAKFNADQIPLFNSKRINVSLLGNDQSITDAYNFNIFKAYHELKELDESLNARKNYERVRIPLEEEQIEKASETLSLVMQSVGFTFTKEEIADVLDETSLHNMTDSLRLIKDNMYRASNYMHNNPTDSSYKIDPFSYTSDNGVVGALRNLIRPLTDAMEEVTQNTVYDNGKLYQEYTIPSFLSKLCQKLCTNDWDKLQEYMAKEYGESEFFCSGHNFDPLTLREEYHWRLPWLNLLENEEFRKFFDHRVNLSYKGKNYMKTMNDLEYAMSVLSQYWSMSSKMESGTQAYFRMPMQSNKPAEDYIGFVANRNKERYKKEIVEGTSTTLGLYHMFLTELSRIQTVRMRNKNKKDSAAFKNFDTNGRNFCFFKFLNPYLNGMSEEYKHNGYSTNLLASKEIFDAEGNVIENTDDREFASLLQKKIKGEEALTSEEELKFGDLAKKAIYNYLQNRFESILDTWQQNGIIKAARKITNIVESHVSIANDFNEKNQKAEYKEREKKIDSYIRSQLENFLWNDYFATKNILMLTVGDTAFYKDEEDLQKRLAQLHAPGLRGRVSAVDYEGKSVSDGKYRTAILKDFDKVKSNIIDNITEVFDRKIAVAPGNMKAQWKALKESVLKAYSEINVADAEGFTSPTAYRKKAIMFGKWSRDAERIYQKISKGESVDYTEIKQAFQPLKPFVYSHLQKNMGVEGAPITKMYCPFQAKNSEYLLVMADVLLRNEKTSRPNLLKAIFEVMEDSAFDGRQRDEDGKIIKDKEGTYNGKGIDTIQFESAIKSSLQGAIDIVQFADNLAEGEKKAKEELCKSIYKAGTQGYDSSAYNTDVFVQELPYEDYCLQQDVPDHFKDHEQAHGSQTRMIIPSDLEEYYDESKDHNDPDNIVKYEYDEWQETTDEKGKKKWEKVHVSKTAKEIKEEYENTIYDNIQASLDNLCEELHLKSSSKVERNLALSKILQRELHSSPRYGIDLMQACTIDKVTGEFRIPKGDPIQCKRIEQLINSIIKNRVNKQLIPGGPIVQVSNFGVSRQLHIRFNDKNGKLMMTKEEFVESWKPETPIENNKQNVAKLASKLMKEEKLTYPAALKEAKSRLDKPASTQSVDKAYEEYVKTNQGGIAYFEVFAPAWSEELYRNFADENGNIDVKAIEETDPDLLKLVTYRIPTEDKCSIAPCKIVGFLPKEAGSTIMLPYELTSQDGSDFDIDKRYVMRKQLDIIRSKSKIVNELFKEVTKEKNYSEEAKKKAKEDIKTYVNTIFSDHSETAKFLNGGKSLDRLYNKLRNGNRWRYIFTTSRPKSRNMRNNKIIDLSWSILTNPTSADKVLKPEGFDEQKKVGYMIAAYKNNPNISWDELEDIANGEKGIENLKKLSYVEKDLAFIDTQLQFYKQNAAAASLIGVFAVNKIAHSTLEGDGIYICLPDGIQSFTIGHTRFFAENGKMELDPRFDTEGNNIGGVLGSLVGASADAVKDPILNLMNINMNTANILNTLLRLGMSFKEAAIFLSQSVITKALTECDKQSLERPASIRKVIGEMIKSLNDKNGFSSDSNIATESIEYDELVEGLLEGDHEAIDYKVLNAFGKILELADMLRKPTLVTRFNSIAGAVGPLVIDNLMTEYKLGNFTSVDGTPTGFEYQDSDGEWIPATFFTILAKHPILAGFYHTYGIANSMFSDTPAGSTGFSKLINSLGDMTSKVMSNRQLLNSFVNFYTSYLLIDSGLLDSSKLEYYIKEFPIEFCKIKDADKEGKYKGNKLIEALFLKEYSKSSNPSLQLNITGLDTLTKEELSSAWIDLYHLNEELAIKLFEYNAFRGGLEFSPKTFISLLPNYIKERISKQLPNGSKVTYLDVYRKLDFSHADPDIVVDQFVRNNWDNNGLVPYVKYSNEMVFNNDTLSVVSEEDKTRVLGNQYIKTKIGDSVKLFEYDKENSGDKVMTYKEIDPLGNNGEYLEMAIDKIDKAMVSIMSDPNENKSSHLSPDIYDDGVPYEDSSSLQTVEGESKKALDLAELFMSRYQLKSKEAAAEMIGYWKKSMNSERGLSDIQKSEIQKIFNSQGLMLDENKALEMFKKLC